MERGVLYVAVGNEFVDEATISARTLQQEMPDLPTAIVSDEDVSASVFDTVIEVDDPCFGFRDKIAGIRRSPFDQTVYLDTDVFVAGAFPELFEVLDRFDIAATHNPNRDLDTSDLDVPASFPEYNTGVLAYDTAACADLFEAWADQYRDDHAHDQPSFRKVTYESDVRIATLPREYNCMIRYPGKVVEPVKIFHGRLLEMDSPGAPKYFDVEDAVDRVNGYEGHRIYKRGGRIAGWPRVGRMMHLLRYSLRTRGVAGTVKSGSVEVWNKARAALE